MSVGCNTWCIFYWFRTIRSSSAFWTNFLPPQLKRLSAMGRVLEPEVTLFNIKNSSFAQRVRIFLEEKGISYNPIDSKWISQTSHIFFWSPVPFTKRSLRSSTKANRWKNSWWFSSTWKKNGHSKFRWCLWMLFEKSKVRFWSDYIYKSLYKIGDTWNRNLDPRTRKTQKKSLTCWCDRKLPPENPIRPMIRV